jgi:prolyl 4-hydroxylase
MRSKAVGKKASAISLEETYDTPVDDLKKRFEITGEIAEREEQKPDFRLTKYIKVFDDALPPEYCDKIVNKFLENADNHIVRGANGEKFVSLNIEMSAAFEEISVTQRKIIEATLPVYAKSVMPHQSIFPERSMVEDLYVYQFRDDNDVRETNIDITNYGQARRYLTFIWFLTDDEDFEVGFFDVQNTVSAKKGRLLMFPSTWTYPYSIANSKNNQNYLVKTHLTLV